MPINNKVIIPLLVNGFLEIYKAATEIETNNIKIFLIILFIC
jgi:hypothetical protein